MFQMALAFSVADFAYDANHRQELRIDDDLAVLLLSELRDDLSLRSISLRAWQDLTWLCDNPIQRQNPHIDSSGHPGEKRSARCVTRQSGRLIHTHSWPSRLSLEILYLQRLRCSSLAESLMNSRIVPFECGAGM